MTSAVPPRRLVALYVLTAHVALALAFALVAWDPRGVAGFFYHSRMVAIVHLVTIGWIAMSILGNLYVVLPMALGVSFPARGGDYAAYALVVIGLIGMVAHFWLSEFSGMAWSAATAAAGVAHVVGRLVRSLRQARAPGGVKLHLHFASANILGAIVMGTLLGFDKVYQFLPGYVLTNVFAHAHLAAVGWASMMVVGLGYRLLPMVIPAASPSGWTIYISAILLEIGVVGLFVALVTRSAGALPCAVLIVAGFAGFGWHVAWMLGRPKRAPPGRGGSDFAKGHVTAAGGWLLLACGCGLMLTALPTSETTMRAVLLYGVFGLVGFLAQAIVGFERRILPIAAAYWALERSGGVASGWPPVPNVLSRVAVFCAWLAGVPALGAGFFFDAPLVLALGAWALLGAAVLSAVDSAMVLTSDRVS